MNKQKDNFNYFLLLSLGFHGLIFVVLTVKILFFPSESLEYKQAVRVDVVALPEKQIERPKPQGPKKPEPVKKPVAKKDPPKPKPKKVKPKPMIPSPKKIVKNKPNVKKIKNEQNDALARLRAMQKLKDKNPAPPVEYKGNQKSPGNSLEGIQKLHHDSYLSELDNHIRNYWNLPEWLANGNFKASVVLLINRNGGVLGKTLIVKSGNDLFDQHVFTTIDKASPLPAPPTSLIDFYATKGVEIRFPE